MIRWISGWLLATLASFLLGFVGRSGSLHHATHVAISMASVGLLVTAALLLIEAISD